MLLKKYRLTEVVELIDWREVEKNILWRVENVELVLPSFSLGVETRFIGCNGIERWCVVILLFI